MRTKNTWRKISGLLCAPALRIGILFFLALFGIASLILCVFIIKHDQSFSMPPHCFVSNEEVYTCLIITECLDKGGCYARQETGNAWCLFGKDVTPEACYNSSWLRKYLNPARLTKGDIPY